MDNLEPITRMEKFLDNAAKGITGELTPITREEIAISGGEIEPVTRMEWFLKKAAEGGGSVQTQTKTATPKETSQDITPDTGYLLSKVTVNPIPSQYIVPTGKKTITANATDIDVTQYASADVAVPTADLGTKSITANGTYAASADNLDGYSEVTVAVPMPDEYAIGGSFADGTATGYYCKRAITSISTDAFKSCAALESIDMPNTVESIGNSAFYKLTNLKNVALPSNLKSIGKFAFEHCGNLTINNGFPEGLKSIGNSAFSNCTRLSIDNLPLSLIEIKPYCFQHCTGLTISSIPPLITELTDSCFDGTGVQFNEIPQGVITIGINCFWGCSNLTSITFKGTPNSIATNSFNNCPNLHDIYVPWSEGAVANAPWGAVNATITYDYTGV